jgi:NodT family efflux transporter outer membrane factor (OMF) lipoprotein
MRKARISQTKTSVAAVSNIGIWILFRASCLDFRALPLVLLLFIASGCLVGPDFKRPKPAMPARYAIAPTTSPTTAQSVATTQPLDVVRWWTQFNDPVLDDLVGRAIESNLDLRLATERIRQARAQRGVTASAFWPQVDVSADYRRSGSGGGGESTSSGGVIVNSGGSRERDLFQSGFDATWELDVFGGVRRSIETANAEIQFSIEDRRDVLVTLASEVARNYLDLRGFQRQIDIARRNLDAQKRSLDLTRQRFNGGFVSRLDVVNAEAQVAATASQIPILEQQAQQTIYSLSVLLGREPTALDAELAQVAPIPTTPPEVPIGLPSELLERRPDIRRAEAQLHAATATVGVATADLFPRFSLTGSLGVQSSKFTNWFNWDSRFWSIGPSVSWPVFDAGRITSNIEVQNSLQRQALITYQQTVLNALNETQSALIAYAKEQAHRAALNDAVVASRQSVDIATRLYVNGQTDFLNVLTAQRALFSSEDALAQSDRTVAQNLVALYKALGGGWGIEREQDRAATANADAAAAAHATTQPMVR